MLMSCEVWNFKQSLQFDYEYQLYKDVSDDLSSRNMCDSIALLRFQQVTEASSSGW